MSQRARKSKKKKGGLRKSSHSHAAPAHIASSPAKVTEFPGPADEPASAFAAERTLGQLTKFLKGKNFSSAEEVNAYIKSVDRSQPADIFDLKLDQPSDDPIERAQELAYGAMEVSTRHQIRRLARQALELDPDCIDALTTLAATEKSPKKVIEQLTAAVKAGERRLGREFFDENRGYFWGLLETRPYMRAREALADTLLADGRVQESIQHREALLDLCASDNLGIRDSLMGLYLAADNVEAASDLLERYEEDAGAVFGWARVLIHYLFREFDKADDALIDARDRNPYVEPYLLLEKEVPLDLPSSYVLGEESEAQVAAFHLVLAMRAHLPARAWLASGGRPGDGKYLGFFTAVQTGKGMGKF